MSAHEAVKQMRTVLEREREAIRKMDAQGVDDCAEDKARLFDVIQAATAARELGPDEVREMCAELRRNGVLLAFARDCVRDVLGLGSPRRAQPTRAVRVSVSG